MAGQVTVDTVCRCWSAEVRDSLYFSLLTPCARKGLLTSSIPTLGCTIDGLCEVGQTCWTQISRDVSNHFSVNTLPRCLSTCWAKVREPSSGLRRRNQDLQTSHVKGVGVSRPTLLEAHSLAADLLISGLQHRSRYPSALASASSLALSAAPFAAMSRSTSSTLAMGAMSPKRNPAFRTRL